jgi:hypothetical protein
MIALGSPADGNEYAATIRERASAPHEAKWLIQTKKC